MLSIQMISTFAFVLTSPKTSRHLVSVRYLRPVWYTVCTIDNFEATCRTYVHIFGLIINDGFRVHWFSYRLCIENYYFKIFDGSLSKGQMAMMAVIKKYIACFLLQYLVGRPHNLFGRLASSFLDYTFVIHIQLVGFETKIEEEETC